MFSELVDKNCLKQHFSDTSGGRLLSDSKAIGWQNVSAEVIAYERAEPDSQFIPAINNAYLVETQTSGKPVFLSQKHGKWTTEHSRRGDSWIFPLGENTHWRWDMPIRTFALKIPIKFWRKAASESLGRDASDIELIPQFLSEDLKLKQLLLLLSDELESGGQSGLLYSEGLVMAILGYLLHNYSNLSLSTTPSCQTIASWQIKEIKDFVEENLESAISVSDLAQLAGCSQFYFVRNFKQITGQSPYQYVLSRRIARAQEMVIENKLSLVEVAYTCGFSSQSHMTDIFRQKLGVTPGRYRRAMLGYGCRINQ